MSKYFVVALLFLTNCSSVLLNSKGPLFIESECNSYLLPVIDVGGGVLLGSSYGFADKEITKTLIIGGTILFATSAIMGAGEIKRCGELNNE